jgi:hypothetical protein
LFCALSRGLVSLLLTLTRLVVVFIFVNFSFALFTPPLGDFHRVAARSARPARPHASGRRCAVSTAEPSPNQRAAARPASRARSSVAAVVSYGDRTAEPTPPMSLQPAPAVRLPSPCLSNVT